nr:coat protein [Ophiovirus lactucae]
MSGAYTVQQLTDILRKPIFTGEDTTLLKTFNLVDSKESPNTTLIESLRVQLAINPEAVVSLKTDGTLDYSNGPSRAVEKSTVGETSTGPVVNYSIEKVKELLGGKLFKIDENKVKEALENYIKLLPKTSDSYKSGDVKVFYYDGVEKSVSSLLAAGTKVLDSILYMAHKDSAEHSFIFDESKLSPKTLDSRNFIENVNLGNKAIKAAFCSVYNQGGLPTKTSEERNLSKFIRETVFKNKDLKSNVFCDMLSSSDPSFFPSSIFLKIPLDLLPTEVSSRCKMAVAGNKAIRYAILARRFEQSSLAEPTTGKTEDIKNYMSMQAKLEKACKITELLSSLGSNFEAQKKMHPLSDTRTVRKNFTLQLTCAIVHSLSHTGRLAMRAEIESKKIEAFKRDENIYGQKNAMDVICFPVLTNSDADFSELSVEAVKTAYGIIS